MIEFDTEQVIYHGKILRLPIAWLLEGEPWVAYRTRRDLLGQPEEHPQVRQARQAMLSDPHVQSLIVELNGWPGTVIASHKSAGQPFHKLTFLANLGLKQGDPGMEVIIGRILEHQSEEGPFQLPTNIPTHYGGTGQDTWTWALCDAPLTVYALRQDGFAGEIALALKDVPASFLLSGARVPAQQDQVRLTLTVPPLPTKEPLRLSLEGRATIEGKEVVRPAVPADDMMQAFAYRHLVPAQELRVAISERNMTRVPVRIVSLQPVKLPAGGTARVQVATPPRLFAGQVQLELSEPPEGIAVQSITVNPAGAEIVLQSDAAKVKSGLAGNLIVNAFVERELPAGAAKAAANRRRIPLGTLPAIPFEIVSP